MYGLVELCVFVQMFKGLRVIKSIKLMILLFFIKYCLFKFLQVDEISYWCIYFISDCENVCFFCSNVGMLGGI